jgi:glutamate-1-semialdehyde 2,1-aminomutase
MTWLFHESHQIRSRLSTRAKGDSRRRQLPVRAFRGVGGNPPFIARGEGSHIFDVDGNEYIDYVGSWGPLLLGHRHPAIVEAVRQALEIGTSFGAPTEQEIDLAEAIRDAVPFHGDGAAGQLRHRSHHVGHPGGARIHRPRPHRQVRRLLSRPRGFAAGEGRLGPGHAGHRRYARRAEGFTDTTIALPFNSVDAVEAAFRAHGERIAAVIVEPVVGNMGCVPPQPGFLEALREITARHGALLILDEVMTGFRVAFGGAQRASASGRI